MFLDFNYLMMPFFFKVRRAEVEALTRIFLPLINKVRFWMLGLKILRVLCWENETLCPYILPLPEISQMAIILPPLLYRQLP